MFLSNCHFRIPHTVNTIIGRIRFNQDQYLFDISINIIKYNIEYVKHYTHYYKFVKYEINRKTSPPTPQSHPTSPTAPTNAPGCPFSHNPSPASCPQIAAVVSTSSPRLVASRIASAKLPLHYLTRLYRRLPGAPQPLSHFAIQLRARIQLQMVDVDSRLWLNHLLPAR